MSIKLEDTPMFKTMTVKTEGMKEDVDKTIKDAYCCIAPKMMKSKKKQDKFLSTLKKIMLIVACILGTTIAIALVIKLISLLF